MRADLTPEHAEKLSGDDKAVLALFIAANQGDPANFSGNSGTSLPAFASPACLGELGIQMFGWMLGIQNQNTWQTYSGVTEGMAKGGVDTGDFLPRVRAGV